MAASDAGFLDLIDWQRPWLEPLLPLARRIVEAADWRQALNQAASARNLCNHRGLPIQFVPQAELPAGMAYEAYISETGRVPTRENLHDFFNALVWLSFPAIKVQLNALQAAEITSAMHAISHDGKQASGKQTSYRGRVRDAATIFDENAALLIVSDLEVAQSLRGHHWQDAFIKQRDMFSKSWEVRLFGHALIEKLVSPYKAITAHAWLVQVDPSFFVKPAQEKQAVLDELVASGLMHGLTTSDFTPLPVLGIPGWWAVQDHAFYEDTSVFRPKRSKSGNHSKPDSK